jgi:hypothetical protein
MAGRARVVLRPNGFQSLLFNIGGAGRRMLERKAERVAALARINSASNGSIPEGIIVGPVVGKKIEVISTNRHSLLVHNGSPRHFIRPRRSSSRARLRFMVGGRIVYARVVDHPGYRGNPFLTDALRDAG